MDVVDIELLIAEVQKRSQIYDPSLKEYHDKNVKKNLWNQICQQVYASVWSKLSSVEKTKYGKELQKKWGSLRRGFRRELSLQKTTPIGGAAKKRKKYVYFDNLLFLTPFTTLEDNESSIEEGNSTEEQHLPSSSFKIDKFSERSKSNEKLQSRNSECYDDEILKVLKERNELLSIKNNSYKTTYKNEDDDEAFLKSLLPSIKQFRSDDKLLLRIELMKTILNFKKSSNDNLERTPTYQSQNYANMGYVRNYASDNESHVEEYIPRSVLMTSHTRRHSTSSTYTPSSNHRHIQQAYNSTYNSSPIHVMYNMKSPGRETYNTPSPVPVNYNTPSPVHYTYGAAKHPVAAETDSQDSLLSLS